MNYFHEGEVALQAEAGVDSAAFEAMAQRSMTPGLGGREARFVEERTFGVATTVDALGRPWSSPLFGSVDRQLFTVEDPLNLLVAPGVAPGDPLTQNIVDTSHLGILFFDPSFRRRIKSLGRATAADGVVKYEITRNFGICNKYIYKRNHTVATNASLSELAATTSAALDDDSISQLTETDTAFLASYHPDNGPDPTHRGGPAGFVTVLDGTTLSMPDYMGNGMFNTLGNLRLDDRVGCMTVDFATGRTVHLTGRGVVRPSPKSDELSERTLFIEIDEVVVTHAAQGTWVDVEEFPIRPRMINPATPYLAQSS